jgi:aspartate/methionine/tyrosine aminotransferase
MFSSRSAFDLAPNRLALALERARSRARAGGAGGAGGPALLDLTESNPTRAGVAYATEAILAALARPAAMRYEPAPFGLLAAREAVARDLSAHGPPVEAARVVLTASTSEAYAFAFKLLCDPGDEVLVPTPSYPLFEHLARLEAVRAVPYRLAYDGAWHIDRDQLRGAVSARTRAIVLVSPNNPTGSYVTRDELRAVASLGVPIVSDEVFSRYALRKDPRPGSPSTPGARASSALEAEGAPLVLALGGLSKLAALPQMKVAWMAVGGESRRVDEALARLEVISDAFLSVGTPVQHALPELLASRARAEAAILARLRRNAAVLRDTFAGSAASVLDAQGGWYATLRLPRTRGEEEWALAFLEEDAVYVHPGHFFDFEDEAYVVLSLLTPEDALRDGARRIATRVAAG